MHFLRRASLVGAVAFSLSSFAAPANSTPDGFVTSKAKLALWTTAGLRSTDVHVDTTNGVVTLHGKVPSADQRALAEKTAAGIEGARSVKNLLQVVPASDEKAVARSDKEINDAAGTALKNDAALKDSKISIKSVDKGVVLLTGSANSYGDHLHAIAVVDRVPGVRRIATEVTTPKDYVADERVTFLATDAKADAKKTETRNGANDSRITMAVKLRLLTASQVPSTEISVDTEDAVVTLFGIVPTADVKNAAAQEAAKVDGVKRVDNQLEVVASANKKIVEAKDDAIKKDLEAAFKDRPEQKNVTTDVKNGTVRLSGKVPSGWARIDTLRVARSVAGVRGIDDQLKVE